MDDPPILRVHFRQDAAANSPRLLLHTTPKENAMIRRQGGRLPKLALGMLVGWFVFTPVIGAPSAQADDALEARQLVERARLAFEDFLTDPQMAEPMRAIVQQAKAVLIYPQVIRVAFIVGASGGSGVLLVRDPQANAWGGPAFYTIGQGSVGPQAGGDAADIVLVAMTDRGVSSLLSTSTKLGADVGVTLGPIGAGAEAATANLSVDILSYSRSKGLYAGASLNGAVVVSRDALNHAYYGKDVSPTAILMFREVSNPHAASLIEAVAKVAAGK
jgi:lipid-binding SYLF domain-containing protein